MTDQRWFYCCPSQEWQSSSIERSDAEGSFSDLLSFLDMIVLPDIWTANKHDVQLGKVPEGEGADVKRVSEAPNPGIDRCWTEITHISLLQTGGRKASWFSLIQFSTWTRKLLIFSWAVYCGTCWRSESCSAVTRQSPKVGEGFSFLHSTANSAFVSNLLWSAQPDWYFWWLFYCLFTILMLRFYSYTMYVYII